MRSSVNAADVAGILLKVGMLVDTAGRGLSGDIRAAALDFGKGSGDCVRSGHHPARACSEGVRKCFVFLKKKFDTYHIIRSISVRLIVLNCFLLTRQIQKANSTQRSAKIYCK